MNERLKFLGRLEEKRLEAEQMKLRMEGLRIPFEISSTRSNRSSTSKPTLQRH